MDKKVFLAVTLCAAIYLIWYSMYSKNQAVPPAVPIQQKVEVKQTAQEQVLTTQKTTEFVILQDTVVLGEKPYAVEVSPQGGVIHSIKLTEYKGQKLEALTSLIGGKGDLELTTPALEWSYISGVRYQIKNNEKTKLILSYEDTNLSIERTYSFFQEKYYLDHLLKITFKKHPPNHLFVGLQAYREATRLENERREVLFLKSKGITKWDISKIDNVQEDLGDGQWTGISSRYFLKALLNIAPQMKPQFQARPISQEEISINLIYMLSGGFAGRKSETIQSTSIQIPLRLYYGPKDIDILKAAGHNLDSSVDFGWFTVVAYPLLVALKWFYKYVNNFGIAIILLTVLVKILTYPLTYKSMKSMKEMQKVQPQLQKVREKYKDDKEKLNKEMLQLMRAHGYNPMSGCWPILIQMPIFIALYNVLYGAIDLYGEPFFGWIRDLSEKDPFYVTPIILTLVMYLQQKITPATVTDPMQQKMMTLMPVIFGFMMLWLPSGLTLYMLVNSVVSIAQQAYLTKSFQKIEVAA